MRMRGTVRLLLFDNIHLQAHLDIRTIVRCILMWSRPRFQRVFYRTRHNTQCRRGADVDNSTCFLQLWDWRERHQVQQHRWSRSNDIIIHHRPQTANHVWLLLTSNVRLPAITRPFLNKHLFYMPQIHVHTKNTQVVQSNETIKDFALFSYKVAACVQSTILR